MPARKWMTWKVWLALIMIVIIGTTVLIGLVAQKLLATRIGAIHTSTLPSPPRFLTDSLAEVKAKQALEAEGYNLKRWQAMQISQSTDPDGNHDKYLMRGGSNSGTI